MLRLFARYFAKAVSSRQTYKDWCEIHYSLALRSGNIVTDEGLPRCDYC